MTSRRRPRPSTSARIAIAAGLLALVLLTAGALGIRAAVHATQLQATQQLAAAEATQITDDLLNGVQLYGPFGSLPYVLLRSDGAVIASSSEDEQARMPPPSPDSTQTSGETWSVAPTSGFGANTAVSSTLRASSMTAIPEEDLPGGSASKDSTVYRAYVFVAPTAADGVVSTMDPFLIGCVVVTVALITASAALSAKRSLRPVERMRAVAADIADAPHGARVDVPETRDELQALAITLNGMLARVDAAAARQKRFIADAAHELRSPLNTLLATVEIARAHPEALPTDRTLATVETEARRLAELAENLLDLAAVEAQSPSYASCDVVEVAQGVVAERQTRVPVTVTAPAGPALAAIAGPALGRIVTNLLDNGLRYAATRVDVRIERNPAVGAVRIEVSNDGLPLELADRERIFEPFVRLDPSRTRQTGGAGLGLAISREMVTRAGGTLKVTSVRPHTTFTVTLPDASGQPERR